MYPSEQHSAPTLKPNREPWFAANLSKICPGIGQIYAGKTKKGLGFLLGYFFLIGLGGVLLSHANVNVLLGIFALIAAFLVPLRGVILLYSSLPKHFSRRDFEIHF
jgi:signal peptidase I